jgi:hypothetical protein
MAPLRIRCKRIDAKLLADGMSAIGPKQTSLVAPHMSAFRGKADMTVYGMSAFAVAIGGKADIAFCSAGVCF